MLCKSNCSNYPFLFANHREIFSVWWGFRLLNNEIRQNNYIGQMNGMYNRILRGEKEALCSRDS